MSPTPARAFSTEVHEDISRRAMRRFPIKTLTVIANTNAEQDDLQNKYDARHFNDCAFLEASRWIRSRYEFTLNALESGFAQGETNCEFRHCAHLEEAARHFGQLLHTVQDFYAHSNWVVVAPDKPGGKDLEWQKHLRDDAIEIAKLPTELAFSEPGQFCKREPWVRQARVPMEGGSETEKPWDVPGTTVCGVTAEGEYQTGDFPLLRGEWSHRGWTYSWQEAEAGRTGLAPPSPGAIPIYTGRVGNILDGENGGRCTKGPQRGHWDRGGRGLHNDTEGRPNFARARVLAFIQTVYELARLEFLLRQRDPELLIYVRQEWALGAPLFESEDLDVTIPPRVGQGPPARSFFQGPYHYGLQLGGGGWVQGNAVDGGALAVIEQRLGSLALELGGSRSNAWGLRGALVYRYDELGGISAGLHYLRDDWRNSDGAINLALGYEVIPAGAIGGIGIWTINTAFGLGYSLQERMLSAQTGISLGVLR